MKYVWFPADMTKQTLEERFTKLEAKLDKLSADLESVKTKSANGWQRAIERYAGDDDLQAVFAMAMKLREADRKRARQRRRNRAVKD